MAASGASCGWRGRRCGTSSGQRSVGHSIMAARVIHRRLLQCAWRLPAATKKFFAYARFYVGPEMRRYMYMQ